MYGMVPGPGTIPVSSELPYWATFHHQTNIKYFGSELPRGGKLSSDLLQEEEEEDQILIVR
jgi:hypothetical protein